MKWIVFVVVFGSFSIAGCSRRIEGVYEAADKRIGGFGTELRFKGDKVTVVFRGRVEDQFVYRVAGSTILLTPHAPPKDAAFYCPPDTISIEKDGSLILGAARFVHSR
jgi:hypothetical protein